MMRLYVVNGDCIIQLDVTGEMSTVEPSLPRSSGRRPAVDLADRDGGRW
jgi:hypothetical protein